MDKIYLAVTSKDAIKKLKKRKKTFFKNPKKCFFAFIRWRYVSNFKQFYKKLWPLRPGQWRHFDNDDNDETKSHGATRRNSNNGKCKENRGEIIKSAILLPKSLRDLDKNKNMKKYSLSRFSLLRFRKCYS